MMKKGFTLVELLASLTILAVVALIATPIIVRLLNSAKNANEDNAKKMYLKAVESFISTSEMKGINILDGEYYVMINGNLCSEDTAVDTCNGIEIKPKVTGSKAIFGTITVQDETIVSSEIYMKKVCTIISGDGTHIGDEIGCGSENFYIVSTYDNKIQLLPKYNLNVGPNRILSDTEGIQNSKVTCNDENEQGCVQFSDNYGWKDVALDIQENDGPTKTAINNYKKTLEKSGVYVVNIDLLTTNESSKIDHYNWFNSLTFWTKSNYQSSIYCDSPTTIYLTKEYTEKSGVRPVITITNIQLK